MDFENLFEEVRKLPNIQAKMGLWDDFVIDLMEYLSVMDNEKYIKYYMYFYIMNYGYHFNEDMLKYAFLMMKNVDGTTGEHWSIEEVEVVAKLKGILPSQSYNVYDVAYVANMYASDNWDNSLMEEENTEIIFKFTKGFLQDPDGAKGKAMRFFKKVVLWKPKE